MTHMISFIAPVMILLDSWTVADAAWNVKPVKRNIHALANACHIISDINDAGGRLTPRGRLLRCGAVRLQLAISL